MPDDLKRIALSARILGDALGALALMVALVAGLHLSLLA